MRASPVAGKRFYTVEEANATLPLLRSILRDIVELAPELRDRHERLNRLRARSQGNLDAAYSDEVVHMEEAYQRDCERMQGYEDELRKLNVELKDYFTGLVDFPCRMKNREVYLCWRLGEPQVEHWHDLDAGFAGRQKLKG